MKKEQRITELKAKMDVIMDEFAVEYEALAVRSEELYDENKELKKAYEALNSKTGLNALSEELGKLAEAK